MAMHTNHSEFKSGRIRRPLQPDKIQNAILRAALEVLQNGRKPPISSCVTPVVVQKLKRDWKKPRWSRFRTRLKPP
jgi:hypothetical protein